MPDSLVTPETVPHARQLARAALEGCGKPLDEEGIADTIANLMHLADELGYEGPGQMPSIEGQTVLADALTHYYAEVEN